MLVLNAHFSMKNNADNDIVLASARIHPTQDDLDRLNQLFSKVTDWEYAVSNIIQRGTGPLLFKKLDKLSNGNLMPAVEREKLQQSYYKSLSRGMVLINAFQRIVEAFREEGIEVVALKGILLSEWLYGDIGLRQFSDLDLLVLPADGRRCLKILEIMGYSGSSNEISDFVKSQTEIVHYTPMVKNEISVEIHIKLHRRHPDYAMKLEDLISDAQPVVLHQKPALMLSLDDLLIHLCVHIEKHFRSGHVQFTSYNDVVNLLCLHADDFDWESFLLRTELFKCKRVVMIHLLLVHKYYRVDLPPVMTDMMNETLDPKDEELFLKYLSGHRFASSYIVNTLQHLRRMNRWTDAVHYAWDMAFPSKQFMIKRYKIRRPQLYFLYYPYRHFLVVKKLLFK